MLKYFDRAFFKFLIGFVGIITAGFIVLIAVGYYQVETQGSNSVFTLNQ